MDKLDSKKSASTIAEAKRSGQSYLGAPAEAASPLAGRSLSCPVLIYRKSFAANCKGLIADIYIANVALPARTTESFSRAGTN